MPDFENVVNVELYSVPHAHPFAILDLREQFRLIRMSRAGTLQISEASFRKLGTDWAHEMDGNDEVNGIQIDPDVIVKVNIVAYTLQRGEETVKLSNVAWNQICTLAWDNGWRPELDYPMTEHDYSALHIKYESVELVPDAEARELAAVLGSVGAIPLGLHRIDAELVAAVQRLAAGGAFEVH